MGENLEITSKDYLSLFDTGNAQGELVLTIMSALAQEESRSISENIRWSLQKKFQNGEPIVNADGSINENRLTGIRRKTFRINRSELILPRSC